jgi:hypothetical protein
MGSVPPLVGVSIFHDLDKVAAFITGAGFSVFVAVWFMVKVDRKLEELATAIRELSSMLNLLYRIGESPRGAGMSRPQVPRGE